MEEYFSIADVVREIGWSSHNDTLYMRAWYAVRLGKIGAVQRVGNKIALDKETAEKLKEYLLKKWPV